MDPVIVRPRRTVVRGAAITAAALAALVPGCACLGDVALDADHTIQTVKVTTIDAINPDGEMCASCCGLGAEMSALGAAAMAGMTAAARKMPATLRIRIEWVTVDGSPGDKHKLTALARTMALLRRSLASGEVLNAGLPGRAAPDHIFG